MRNLSQSRKMRSALLVAVNGLLGYTAISFYKNDETFYRNIVMPIVHLLEPEKAHNLAVAISHYRLIPRTKYRDSDLLKVRLFGKEFPNPIGIAAGFDKNGEAVLGLNDIGFGFVEIGSVTPLPQPGNEKPRVFRLSNDLAIINRYGFNSDGHNAVFDRLNNIKIADDSHALIGVNLGKNKTSEDPIDDYVKGVQKFGTVADYLVINISSPNTPGLRSMQSKETLKQLLKAVVTARNNLPENHRPPLLLKLAPDLSNFERKDIADVIQQKYSRVDGLIVSNTTIERPHYLSNKQLVSEVGGLSGKPLRDTSTEMISEMYKLTNGKIPIIGVGGIFSGQDAYDKIKAGASAVQIYTSLVYEGPPIVTKIKKELNSLLEKDGFRSVSEAVGKNVK